MRDSSLCKVHALAIQCMASCEAKKACMQCNGYTAGAVIIACNTDTQYI